MRTTCTTDELTARPPLDLHTALNGGLRTPLAVLRASLETLALRFEERDPRRPQVVAALAQVTRLQHNLQTVLDCEHAPAHRPLACTLQEIVKSAVGALVPEHRSRCLAAVESGDARLCVDGPLLSRALTRLIEAGLDQSQAPVLLRSRVSAGRACFSVLLTRFEPGQASMEALAEQLARRDTDQMRGAFARRSSAEHEAIFELTFPLADANEEAA